MSYSKNIALLFVTVFLASIAMAATEPATKYKIVYKLGNGSETWDPKVREKIVASMDGAVALYNELGEFDKTIVAAFNAGTPTADGNYNGHINFGTQMSKRTALHEIAHTLGIGQYKTWQ